jgi:hypothetical protein
MGGPGLADTTAPKHLFAAGYAACFGIAVKMHVRSLTLPKDEAVALAEETHEMVCPYSYATRGNVDFSLECLPPVHHAAGELPPLRHRDRRRSPVGRRQTRIDQAYLLFVGRWARRLSWKETAEAFRTSRDKVFDAVEHVVMFDLEHRTVGQIDAIVVEEIQYAIAHKYLTLVYQIDPGVIWGFTFLKQHVGDQL